LPHVGAVVEVEEDDEDVEVDVVVVLLLDTLGHVQSPLQMKAPVGLVGFGQVALPGGSHCSPGSITPFPQVGAVDVVVDVVVVTVTDVTVDDVVVVVVDALQLPQQSRCPPKTTPPSATQWLADFSTSHFAGNGHCL